MPIRINLLEEEQKAKLARKRDPIMLTVRLSLLGLLVIFSLSVILYARERALNAQLAGLRTEWTQREPKSQKTEADIKALQKLVAKTDVVRNQVQNRFLWAPQLELYKDVIPSTVQVTRFVGHREVNTPAPPAPGTKGPAPTPTESVRVTLEGIAEGGRPELVVDDFLMQLKSSKRLTSQVEEIKLVSLNKGNGMMNKVASDSTPEQPSARFVIEIKYKQRPIKQA